jgi:SPOR domain
MVTAMKQSNASIAALDLDDLERQLAVASAPKKVLSDDPLAELARIVGQDDPLGGGAKKAVAERIPPSFEDFLKVPPRPLSGAMPPHTPPVEPLYSAPAESSPAPAAETMQAFDAVTAGLAPKIELRPDLPIESVAPPVAEIKSSDIFAELEARLARAVEDEKPLSRVDEPIMIRAPIEEIAPVPAPPAVRNEFDDMLAEFEATMRDAGAQPTDALHQPPLAPVAVPPPQAEPAWQEPPAHPEIAPAGASLGMAGAAAAGGAVIAAAATRARRTSRGVMLAGGVIGVALIGVAGLLAFGGSPKSGAGSANAPVIAAKPGATKERPANPGGVEVPNQDKEVLQTRAPENRQAERVAPREEQPVDLNQAQRSAEQQAAGGVRQIPGVSVVAPAGGVPQPSAPPPAVPRPVASVPITIAGQPPVAAPAPVPVAPAPVVAPAPAATPPAAPSAAAPAATPPQGEPRRVRAVPIRPEDGAPARAQAQPRVVPANPRPAPQTATQQAIAPATEDGGPLRITPQASRAAPRQDAAPAPGTVPTSTSAPTTQAAAVPPPITTQSTGGGGSGFSVQLAAEGSQEAAQAKFGRVRGQHGEVLGGMNPNIRSAEVNGRSVYRVRVGNMSREEAVSLCEKLKADGGSCFVAKN